MSQTSPVLSLPYIQPAQAQKHVTHNEALRILDAITQLSVIDTTLTAPPAQPSPGDRYIVADPATGTWAGQETSVAVWVDNTWQFFAPGVGWRADIAGTGEELRFDGTDWVSTATGGAQLENLPGVGINTTSDTTNKLSVSADATLLNHAGGGHQLKLNKASTGNTNSLLFQTGFSARAEMGTAGSDDFAIKVSDTGAIFKTAMRVDAATGGVQFPSGQAYYEDVFIANDSAWSVDIPWADPARILLWIAADSGDCALVAITGALSGVTNFAEVFTAPGSTFAYLGGALTGTTGTAGAISLSIDTGGAAPQLHVENRLGAGQIFTLSTLGK